MCGHYVASLPLPLMLRLFMAPGAALPRLLSGI